MKHNAMEALQRSRREFLKNIAIGSGCIAIFGNYGFRYVVDKEQLVLKSIVVDFTRCTGCHTCETACSASNHKVKINGEMIKGLGNPFLSNIRVHHHNPDADIPVTCALCPDAPCIEACPVEKDLETGRKALYRNAELGTIEVDLKRCIGCASCADKCKEERAGVIIPNPENNSPERMCTLCNGDPNCVKWCPYDALSYLEVDINHEFFAKNPQQIAKVLHKRFYKIAEEVPNEN